MQPTFPIRIGDILPNLSFDAFHNGETVTLSSDSYRGSWLIFFFYPADFTFVCPTELEELAGMYETFKKEGAEIVSVSTDSVESHAKWHAESEAVGKVAFPMAADVSGDLCRMFNTYLPAENVSLRGTFIIDPDGKLMSMEVNDNAVGRSSRELLRKLRALKFTREHAGVNVCQASWEPGDEALLLPNAA